MKRFGSNYSGYWVNTDALDRNSIVYSIGVGEDISFDTELVSWIGCRVYAFDPTPRTRDWILGQNLPNKINFLSYIGRRFFPMEIHTIGEEPFLQWHLKTLLERFRIDVKKTIYLFAVSFPLARILKLLKAEAPEFLISFVLLVERIAERFPIIRRTNSTIVIQGEVK